MSLKICSFLPAATQMIYDLGLQDHLYGVTFECSATALKEKPRVVRCLTEGKDLSSAEIDRIYAASKAEGKSLYYIDEEVLSSIQPDIIFTQDVCSVCQIDTECTISAVNRVSPKSKVISLSPQNLKDVFSDMIAIASAVEKEEKAFQYLHEMTQKTDRITDQLRQHKAMPKRVLLMEWVDPIYNCGHWIPDQMAYAGGIDMLSNPGGKSVQISWEKIRDYNPEILVIAPCGFDSGRAREDMYLLTEKKGWKNLSAVKNNAVFIADYDMFTQPAVSTLVDGIETLAALFNPDIFKVPQQLSHKVFHFSNQAKISVYGS